MKESVRGGGVKKEESCRRRDALTRTLRSVLHSEVLRVRTDVVEQSFQERRKKLLKAEKDTQFLNQKGTCIEKAKKGENTEES